MTQIIIKNRPFHRELSTLDNCCWVYFFSF
jgi:hypothetical protein